MAFKMKYGKGGFPYKSALKHSDKEFGGSHEHDEDGAFAVGDEPGTLDIATTGLIQPEGKNGDELSDHPPLTDEEKGAERDARIKEIKLTRKRLKESGTIKGRVA